MTPDARKLLLFFKRTPQPALAHSRSSREIKDCHAPAEFVTSPAMRTILIIILILLLIGAFPAWPYSSGWGYYPAGGIGLVLLILIILAIVG